MSSKLKFRLALVLCCVMMMSIFAGCGGSESAPDDSGSQGEVIKLGFLGALTGSVANYGIPGKKGMEMAIEEINASGGILGHQVEGVYDDNKGETTDITAIAKKYITRDKVVAMVGDPCTGLTQVAGRIAQDNEVVILSAGATGTGVVEIGDYVYRNTLLDIYAAPAVVDWMVNQKGWKNIAMITSLNNGYSTALTPVFKAAIADKGGNIVLDESINDGETDFTAQVTKLKNAGADVLVFTGYYTEAALIMNEVQKQNLDIVLALLYQLSQVTSIVFIRVVKVVVFMVFPGIQGHYQSFVQLLESLTVCTPSPITEVVQVIANSLIGHNQSCQLLPPLFRCQGKYCPSLAVKFFILQA